MSTHDVRNVQSLRRPLQKTLAAMAGLVLLAGCSTTSASDYVPRLRDGSVGYSDLQLSPNLYRVSFTGSTASTRDDVQTYLLRRAAEVTLQTGHTHFVLTNQDTERDNYYYGSGYYFGGPGYYYPYGGGPYWGDNWAPTSYSAYAQVVMLNADEAARNPQAIDASGVLRRLEPPLPYAAAPSPPQG